MEYGVDITENFFRAVGVLIFGVYKRPELGAEILNSLFALEWVGVFEESTFTFSPALWRWVEVKGENVICFSTSIRNQAVIWRTIRDESMEPN